jgi:hypothetical protein
MAWEYKVLSMQAGGWFGGKLDAPKLENHLNALGAAGWEMASSFDTNAWPEGITRDVVVILKRQIAR